MTPAARVAAAIDILDRIADGEAAERALTRWARGARFAGSGDRAAIRDHVFDVLRRWRSCAEWGGGDTGRALMLGLLRGQGAEPDALFTGQGHAPAPLSPDERAAGAEPQGAAALDLPEWLWPHWQQSLGDQATAVADSLRHRAPVMLRVNSLRATPEAARATLADEGITCEQAGIAPTALRVTEGARRVAQSAAYREGMIELQDGASQASIHEIPAASYCNILDYCAGGGGKALALAARFDAAVTAHDALPARMKDLPTRAARAGAVLRMADAAGVAASAPYDLVFADAPCSGSGAWRRAPEGKWALTQARLQELTATQDDILHRAARLVAPGGVLAYATCSVLTCENEDRVTAFSRAMPDWRLLHQRRWLPGPEGDGFFIAILELSKK
ncbi:RsmB/NOP family class I SAM-dependent RNA methyltransferase [Lutimaribacter sp. EGI FJ00015]|uniref:RsmB/NOP family class I SAM-dependent RNA methyltransferase n=1 Tax=Lutimaribacter degradans TaxID=2945989 RepID=A0ACC5ZW76_9RHOB|nr:RsmB/NOP family class I SAM-dependent RNA methyltransferase [Lutimaribacter sp. EGI FJ00013]MCM2562438.1 RsmB/NOP family class I SAM-dependent RNA methyltransferase [Lutimaribacter sp. EGI FJ00013]MCO0613595.1 RsmB/NOP family class I SAM-dependent RNA methyltransferase [Lutimaribacter sp. EGI FJ00015]MCO0636567.1 RsmB/NOP family class I SAM-dependent RNA methyltransferase [Lutimaribacter sp. EGI FJ00014]